MAAVGGSWYRGEAISSIAVIQFGGFRVVKEQLVHAPVYQQLHSYLRESLGRDYERGDRFLPEREINRQFDVSSRSVAP